MPGRHASGYWEGNRHELLAAYLLSSVASVTQVPHQFDFGIDLLCTLTWEEDRVLTAGRPFGVQVKARTSKETYGGFDKETGKSKKHEIDWLFQQDMPLFYCLVDIEEWKISLYSVQRIWWLLHQKGLPAEVVFQFGEELSDSAEQRSLENRYPCYPVMQTGFPPPGGELAYEIPIGPPIIEISAKEAPSREQRNDIREVLSSWINLENVNIQHAQLRVPYAIEFGTWKPNSVPERATILCFSGPQRESNIREILGSIGPAITALLYHFSRHGDECKLERVRDLARLAAEYGVLDEIALRILNDSQNGSMTT